MLSALALLSWPAFAVEVPSTCAGTVADADGIVTLNVTRTWSNPGPEPASESRYLHHPGAVAALSAEGCRASLSSGMRLEVPELPPGKECRVTYALRVPLSRQGGVEWFDPGDTPCELVGDPAWTHPADRPNRWTRPAPGPSAPEARVGELAVGPVRVRTVELALPARVAPEPTELHVVLVVDGSPSVGGRAAWEQLYAPYARALVAAAGPSAGWQTVWFERAAHRATDDWLPGDAAVERLAPNLTYVPQGSAVDDALRQAVALLEGVSGTRRVVVMTDGRFAAAAVDRASAFVPPDGDFGLSVLDLGEAGPRRPVEHPLAATVARGRGQLLQAESPLRAAPEELARELLRPVGWAAVAVDGTEVAPFVAEGDTWTHVAVGGAPPASLTARVWSERVALAPAPADTVALRGLVRLLADRGAQAARLGEDGPAQVILGWGLLPPGWVSDASPEGTTVRRGPAGPAAGAPPPAEPPSPPIASASAAFARAVDTALDAWIAACDPSGKTSVRAEFTGTELVDLVVSSQKDKHRACVEAFAWVHPLTWTGDDDAPDHFLGARGGGE